MSVWVMSIRWMRAGVEKDLLGHMKSLKSRAVNAPGFLASYSLKEVPTSTNHGVPVKIGEEDIEKENDRKYIILSHWSSVVDWTQWVEDPVRQQIVTDFREYLQKDEEHLIMKVRHSDDTPFLL
eukprot:CAMPEP_0201476726 /NCGR_PEP_ID=MMETSP0151_2-20130828/1875_1 /ASSEMBLY_ACC=CAM_ASM_000257 /TAXON_ID=200890 /ORGANISM="Paramoeba atlantica, Strain 621/1 / CCAP 1560/9" /LENGTH=123 /DNA_ID=CAMNT_0047857191 /DNA_START=94 /DNA_END=465 /DNA_ORIENTATION=+